MKVKFVQSLLLLMSLGGLFHMEAAAQSGNVEREAAHSVLPVDGIINYLPNDTSYFRVDEVVDNRKVRFEPLANFFFRPEGTFSYKEAGLPVDNSQLNFYLRGDFGGKISLPKHINLVFNLQSFGTYTRIIGPLDKTISLYEAYVNIDRLDRRNRFSLNVGRQSIGKYGTEILVGDDDFKRGRSFESVRLRYKTSRLSSDLMWVQLYQQAPDSADFDWNHPVFLSTFNTFNLSRSLNINANLPFIIDQYNSGYRTWVLMPDVRLFGEANHFKYTAEAIYQHGWAHGILSDTATGSLAAYAAEVGVGYFTNNDKFSADVSYYRASGDENPADNQLKSYNVLWQNEHRRFGYIDAFNGSNVQAATLQLNWNITRLFAAGMHGVYAEVLETIDRSPGVSTFPLTGVDTVGNLIGYGGDVYVNGFVTHYLNFQVAAAIFCPGEYFTAVNGIHKPLVRLYILLAVRI